MADTIEREGMEPLVRSMKDGLYGPGCHARPPSAPERHAAGRAARERLKRTELASWERPGAMNPVAVISAQNEIRLPELLRYDVITAGQLVALFAPAEQEQVSSHIERRARRPTSAGAVRKLTERVVVTCWTVSHSSTPPAR